MLKQLINECLVTLHVSPEGPVLVKSGTATVKGPDMAFVNTFRNNTRQVYLPGSSLKGILRSHAERIARTLRMPSACDPFTDMEKAAGEPERSEVIYCGERFKQRESWRNDRKKYEKLHAEEVQFEAVRQGKAPGELPGPVKGLGNGLLYAESCPICRLFGSTHYGGRLATTDGYAVGTPPKPEARDGVGIDRFTGGASKGAKFDLEVLTSGTFHTTLHLRNFELWQLGLVGFLLQDLKDGFIRVGMGKSRGLGKVVGAIQEVKLYYIGPRAPTPKDGKLPVLGIGSLMDKPQAYGMIAPDETFVPLPEKWKTETNGVRSSHIFPGDTFQWKAVADRWIEYIDNYQVPPAMSHARFARRSPL